MPHAPRCAPTHRENPETGQPAWAAHHDAMHCAHNGCPRSIHLRSTPASRACAYCSSCARNKCSNGRTRVAAAPGGAYSRRHRREPWQTRATQQLQQNRFGLIVGVLREPQGVHAVLRAQRVERAITRITRRRFNTDARAHAAPRRVVPRNRHPARARTPRNARAIDRREGSGHDEHAARCNATRPATRTAASSSTAESTPPLNATAMRALGRLRGQRRADRLENEAVGGMISGMSHGGKA